MGEDMASLESIKTKILNDANKKADEILKEANEKAHIMTEEARNSALEEAKGIEKKFLERGKLLSERIQSSGKLAARNEILKAKGEIIEDVFNKAKESLKNVDEETFLRFFMNKTRDRDLVGKVITVSKKYEAVIKEKFKDVNVNSEENLDGFRITENGVSENYSFSRMLDYERENLEAEIVSLLFV